MSAMCVSQVHSRLLRHVSFHRDRDSLLVCSSFKFLLYEIIWTSGWNYWLQLWELSNKSRVLAHWSSSNDISIRKAYNSFYNSPLIYSQFLASELTESAVILDSLLTFVAMGNYHHCSCFAFQLIHVKANGAMLSSWFREVNILGVNERHQECNQRQKKMQSYLW